MINRSLTLKSVFQLHWIFPCTCTRCTHCTLFALRLGNEMAPFIFPGISERLFWKNRDSMVSIVTKSKRLIIALSSRFLVALALIFTNQVPLSNSIFSSADIPFSACTYILHSLFSNWVPHALLSDMSSTHLLTKQRKMATHFLYSTTCSHLFFWVLIALTL